MEDKELKNSTISYKWKNTKLIHVDDVIKSGIPINGITELDLMGGKKSIMEGLVNVDVLAEEGIKARVEDLNKIIKKK